MLPWKLILAFLICGCLWGTSQNQSQKKKFWKNFQNAQVKWERSNVCLYLFIIGGVPLTRSKCPSEKHLHMLTNLLVLRAVELISGFQVDSHVHFICAHKQESSCLLQLNEYEIQRGKKLGVTISYNNHRLFVGNIPKNRERLELYEEFAKHARKLTSVSQVVSGLWVCQS